MKKLSFRFSLVILLGVLAIACWIFWAKTSSPQRPHLTVIGFAKMADGLGRQSVELMDALYDDMKVGFVPSQKSNLTDVPKRIRRLISKPNKNLGKVVIYESAFPNPDKNATARINKFLRGPKNNDQIRIAYSMLESSLIPPTWAEILNEYFDAVAVPDAFLIKVYQDSGVEIPIFVLPLGLDISPFLEQPIKHNKNTPFRFINVSSLIPRKNHEGLIQAFVQAFGDDPNVELHLNYRFSSSKEFLFRIKNLIRSLKVHNIFLTSNKLDNQEYLDFLLQGDAFVSLSKGEGFSIQPREAMALGIPVIISDNTAHTTIVKSGLAHAVPCPSTEIAYNSSLDCECGEEYVADIDAAAKTLRYVYDHYEKCLESSLNSRQWVEYYKFKNIKPLYLSLINPKKVVLGDTNEVSEECLITSSPELYKKFTTIINQDISSQEDSGR